MKYFATLLGLLFIVGCQQPQTNENDFSINDIEKVYKAAPKGVETGWISSENKKGEKGKEGGKTYLHILDDPKTKLLDVPVTGNISKVTLFDGGKEVPFTLNGHLKIEISGMALDDIDTILIIEKEGELEPSTTVIYPC